MVEVEAASEKRDLAVGSYSIDTSCKVHERYGREGQPQLPRYKCVNEGRTLTAKCIRRELIGNAGKRKSHFKWKA